MTSSDMLSINNVAAKLGLSVHQLRRWELMFGLEIKRGRGQQRQYREEDMSVLERIKELVEQGWPTSQIRPQLEAEGLLSPKLIGAPPLPGNPEVLQEAIIGLRNFSERRFIDLSKQIDELRQLLISVTLKQELSTDRSSPWQPMASEYVPAPKALPPQEITIGPQISIDPPKSPSQSMMGMPPTRVNQIPPNPTTSSYSGSGSSPSSTSMGASANASGASTSGAGSSGTGWGAGSTASSSGPGAGTASGTGMASGAGSSAGAASGNTDFSQRSMMGGSHDATIGDSKTSIPDIDQAPKPITDALQRSMSTLDSLFKDSRNTPGGLGAASETGTTSSSTISSTSSSALSPSSSPAPGGMPTGTPPGQPVRYSTIPPQPTMPTTSTTSASQTPAISAPAGSAPASPYASPSSSSSSSSPSSSSSSPSSSSASSPSIPSIPPEAAPASAWDQAFSSTSVDMDAVPASGLFEDSSAAGSTPGAGAAPQSLATAFPPPGQNLAAPYGSERNPFTTITGTNTNAVGTKPTDSGSHSLMGQTDGSGQGFGATATSSTASGQNLSQTGPLPAHRSVESFAPELKEKLVASQSDSTSTDLPQSQPAISSAPTPTESSAPEPLPVAPPALPLATGPQVNFGPNVSAPTPQVTPQRMDDNFGLGEVTDQNYLTVLGRALDLIGWSDEQADSFSLKTFGVPHWDELGRSQAEKLVAHLVGLLKDQMAQ